MPNLVKICIVAKSKKAAAPGVTAGDTPNDGAFGSQGGVSRLESMEDLKRCFLWKVEFWWVCGKIFSGGSFRECIPSIHSKIN